MSLEHNFEEKNQKSSNLINNLEKNKEETIQETINDEPIKISNPKKLSKDRLSIFDCKIDIKNNDLPKPKGVFNKNTFSKHDNDLLNETNTKNKIVKFEITEKEKEVNEIPKNVFRRTQSFKEPKSSVLINKIEKNKIETIQETKNDEPMNISNPNKLSKDRFSMFLKPIEDKNEKKIKEAIFLNNDKKTENDKSILKLNSDSKLKNDNDEKKLILNEKNNKNVETNEIEKEDIKISQIGLTRTQLSNEPNSSSKVDFGTSKTSNDDLKNIIKIEDRINQISSEKLNENENENENEKRTISFINKNNSNSTLIDNEKIKKSPLELIESHFDDLEIDKNELNHLNRARPKPSRKYKKPAKININDEIESSNQDANNIVETTEVTDNIEIDNKFDKIKKVGVALPFMVSKKQLENLSPLEDKNIELFEPKPINKNNEDSIKEKLNMNEINKTKNIISINERKENSGNENKTDANVLDAVDTKNGLNENLSKIEINTNKLINITKQNKLSENQFAVITESIEKPNSLIDKEINDNILAKYKDDTEKYETHIKTTSSSSPLSMDDNKVIYSSNFTKKPKNKCPNCNIGCELDICAICGYDFTIINSI